MYPGYKDKFNKAFLSMEYMVNYSKLLQHMKKRKNKKSLCESEVVGVWEDECIL